MFRIEFIDFVNTTESFKDVEQIVTQIQRFESFVEDLCCRNFLTDLNSNSVGFLHHCKRGKTGNSQLLFIIVLPLETCPGRWMV